MSILLIFVSFISTTLLLLPNFLIGLHVLRKVKKNQFEKSLKGFSQHLAVSGIVMILVVLYVVINDYLNDNINKFLNAILFYALFAGVFSCFTAGFYFIKKSKIKDNDE